MSVKFRNKWKSNVKILIEGGKKCAFLCTWLIRIVRHLENALSKTLNEMQRKVENAFGTEKRVFTFFCFLFFFFTLSTFIYFSFYLFDCIWVAWCAFPCRISKFNLMHEWFELFDASCHLGKRIAHAHNNNALRRKPKKKKAKKKKKTNRKDQRNPEKIFPWKKTFSSEKLRFLAYFVLSLFRH